MRTLAILSLAVGIGLAASLASIVDAILLRPLPVARASEIRRVFTVSQGQPFGFVSYPDFEDFRRGAAMTAECLIPVTVGEPAQMKLALAVTADYFEVLGVLPRYGRTFASDAEMAVILAHGSSSDLGRSVRVAGKLYTVIGVAPENFGLDRFLHQDLFLPIRSYGDGKILEDRARRFLTVHVRGAGLEIPAIAARLAQEHPVTNRGRRAVVLDELTARMRTDHMILPLAEQLSALAILILVASIANGCGASMTRAEARSRDTSIKIALGASPRRLFLESIRESAVISALSCAFALPLAWIVTEMLRKSVALPTDFGISIAPRIDGRVLVLMLVVASLASLVAPLCMRRPRSRQTLAIIEVALAAALIAAGGSCWVGLNAAKNSDLGYRTDHVSLTTFDPGQSGYNELRARAFYRDVLARARALPAVRQVALAQSVPLGMTGAQKQIRIGDQEEMTVWMNIVTREYFDLMRMPLIAGRTFDNRDSVIVNQELAKLIGIGEKLRIGGRALEVIGIVKTAKYMRWDEPPRPFFYLPYEQNYVSRMTLHIESAGTVLLASEIPASDVRPLREYFDNGAMFGIKAALKVAMLTGTGGLLLALTGLYSVISSTVSRRRREIAIRIVLGAPHRTVFAMIVRQGITISLYGTAAGLAVSRLLPVERSWAAAALAAGVILATSLLACAIPAIRALRIHPQPFFKRHNEPMVPIRKIYWLWLVSGIALLLHGIYTGGGLAGLIFYWQLQAFGTIFPGTHALLSIPLIFFPIIALAMDADRRRTGHIDVFRNARQLGKWFTIGGVVLLVGAGLCYWRTTLFPDPSSPPQRIALNEMAPDSTVSECRASLIGRPREIYGVRYEEVMNGRFGLHSKDYHHFVPVTRSDWHPDQPVRFLADTNGEPLSLTANTRGLLLRGHLPGFVRRALTNKGVTIADDVMVFSTRRDFGRTPWFVSTALCSIGAFLFIAMGFAWPRTTLRSERELAVLRPRVGRYVAFSLGGVVMLIGLALAAGKVAHIVSAASTEGVITNVQEGDHTIAKYSFYVEYSTPRGRFDRFARTSTPFERSVGDIVTVIYKPDQPEKPEFLALDDEWIGYAIVFGMGAAVVLLGAIFFRPKAIPRAGS